MGAELLVIIWKNKRLILEVLACLVIAFALWWFVIHNPRLIKQLETEKALAIEQKEAAYAAINLLTNIEVKHGEIDNRSNENIKKIRNSRKPGLDGVFLLDGVLPAVYQADATSDGEPPTDEGSEVQPAGRVLHNESGSDLRIGEFRNVSSSSRKVQ